MPFINEGGKTKFQFSKGEKAAPQHDAMSNEPEQRDDEIDQVVAEHGPAQEVHVKHDHEAGKHHVASHHGAHVHHSEHASAEEAHSHAAKAAGVDREEKDEHESNESSEFEAGKQEGQHESALGY